MFFFLAIVCRAKIIKFHVPRITPNSVHFFNQRSNQCNYWINALKRYFFCDNLNIFDLAENDLEALLACAHIAELICA